MASFKIEFFSEDVAPENTKKVFEALGVLLECASRTDRSIPNQLCSTPVQTFPTDIGGAAVTKFGSNPDVDNVAIGKPATVQPLPPVNTAVGFPAAAVPADAVPVVKKKRTRRTKKELAAAKAAADVAAAAAATLAEAARIAATAVDPLAIPVAVIAPAPEAVAAALADNAAAELTQPSEEEVKDVVVATCERLTESLGSKEAGTQAVVEKLIAVTGKNRVHEIPAEQYHLVVSALLEL